MLKKRLQLQRTRYLNYYVPTDLYCMTIADVFISLQRLYRFLGFERSRCSCA